MEGSQMKEAAGGSQEFKSQEEDHTIAVSCLTAVQLSLSGCTTSIQSYFPAVTLAAVILHQDSSLSTTTA